MNTRSPKHPIRAGFSFLELQVAFLVLGIALAGLVPLVVMQSRQLTQLQDRFKGTYEADTYEELYYLAPSRDLGDVVVPEGGFADPVRYSTNAWACKLGAVASLIHKDVYDVLPSLPGSSNPSRKVKVNSIQYGEDDKVALEVEVFDYLVSGAGILPDCTGDYFGNGEEYGGKPVYEYEHDEENFFIWWSLADEKWIISSGCGSIVGGYWHSQDDAIIGNYVPNGTAGSPKVSDYSTP